jgi:hypothetical protein
MRIERLFDPAKALLLASLVLPSQGYAAPTSVESSIGYLREVQDQFHNRIPVYEDVSSAGNRFHTYAKIPDESATVSINGSWTAQVHSGATAIRCEYVAGDGFGGFYFLNGVLQGDDTAPSPNFGTVPDAGVDLTGTVRLKFWARGENGGERIDFFLAGVGWSVESGLPEAPFPGSSRRHPELGTTFVLSSDWQEYAIEDLPTLDLSYVLGGFGWVATDLDNPSGAVFYLDDIEYELTQEAREERLDEPRFLASYSTLPIQPPPADCSLDPGFDLALRNMAFTYDNALALLAFLAHGTPDSLRRARLIGDAFVYAASRDRFLLDGTLRSGYAASDLALPPGWTPNGVEGAVALPGFFCEEPQMFFETGQEALDIGNNSWAMIALLALSRATADPGYLTAAEDLGAFIQARKIEAGTYQGFGGGIEDFENDPGGPEPPMTRPWASGEHNLDVYAAFTAMAEITGMPAWAEDAEHAAMFVEAIWDPSIGCYRAGTHDPETVNTDPGQLPVDVQAWATLALPDALSLHPDLFACPESFHLLSDAGFMGFDFNEDLDGVWFEGTAQMATAYASSNEFALGGAFQDELQRAQATPPFGDSSGIVASTVDGLSTGFGFEYYSRFHIAVAAWNVFAQLPWNPYYQRSLPTFADGFESGDLSVWSASMP